MIDKVTRWAGSWVWASLAMVFVYILGYVFVDIAKNPSFHPLVSVLVIYYCLFTLLHHIGFVVMHILGLPFEDYTIWFRAERLATTNPAKYEQLKQEAKAEHAKKGFMKRWLTRPKFLDGE